MVSIRGSVVDVQFEQRLPPIFSVLHCGENDRIIIEVLMQLDLHRVRGIALTPTQGLARGMVVKDAGKPLQVPVGKNILSRMFDVFGSPIDLQPPPADVEWRTIHRDPPPLVSRSTKSEVFETGIKLIDVLVPLERGGKAGLFGGAGVGKTVLLSGLIAGRAARKLQAKRSPDGVWFGLGMMGLIGWSVALPTVAGAGIGLWVDAHYPGRHAWALALLVAGLTLGCFNAWRWVAGQQKVMHKVDHE